jgi:hypothetical protein
VFTPFSAGEAPLAGFAVQSVSVAVLAVLFELDAIRVVLLVLLGDVVALLAFGASQGYVYSHL